MARTPGNQKKSYVGANLEERKRRRRTALIDAGLALFGTRGYRNCSVKMVCRQAHLTERYFYESFANREALLIGVFHVLISEMAAQLLGVVENDSLDHEKRLRQFVDSFFRFFQADERRGRLILFEILGVSAEMDRHYQRAVRDLAALVEHPHLGLFRNRRPSSKEARRIMSIGLVGALLQIAVQWAMDGFEMTSRKITNNTLQIFLAVSERHQR